jgi:hypothetical protein
MEFGEEGEGGRGQALVDAQIVDFFPLAHERVHEGGEVGCL